jgi:hypothetical protein
MSNPNYSMRVIVKTKGGRTTSVWVPIASLDRESILSALETGYYEGDGNPRISPVLAGTGIVGVIGSGSVAVRLVPAGNV